MFIAAGNGHGPVVELLLKRDEVLAALQVTSDNGKTALYTAADHGLEWIVKMLLD